MAVFESGKWLCLKGNYYWRGPLFSSMMMGGGVNFASKILPVDWTSLPFDMPKIYKMVGPSQLGGG